MKEAFKYYQKSAETNNVNGMYHYARYIVRGKKDFKERMKYFKFAADGGNSDE
jgi:TPR repeat protein